MDSTAPYTLIEFGATPVSSKPTYLPAIWIDGQIQIDQEAFEGSEVEASHLAADRAWKLGASYPSEGRGPAKVKARTARSGWEILQATCSDRGGLHVQGINHETTDPLFVSFSWEINQFGIDDPRYDFSNCCFKIGAKERLEALRRMKK